MSIKKIKGYKIFMDQKLGKGAYGSVFNSFISRSIRGKPKKPEHRLPSKLLTNQIVVSHIILVNSDPYMKNALVSEIKIMKSLRSDNIVGFHDVMESKNNYYIIQ